jgi:endo-1,3(4)-beta-glucanase
LGTDQLLTSYQLFENKVDHTTYFGNKPAYIHGIHMLPISPISAYMRSPTFVSQEWAQYFSNGRAAQESDRAWQNILFANLAIIDPLASLNHFMSPKFDYGSLDSGASRTWYLAYAAALNGNLGARKPRHSA